jgi:NAD(P)-dependent dehydrogenase (short-subunit alcohol dehydrogenase family)
MSSERTVARVRSALDEVALELDRWCAAPAELLARRRSPQAWSGSEVLEHVTLANRYLLLTLEKHTVRAVRRARSAVVAASESDLERLARIGERTSFPWQRPGHMAPTGAVQPVEARVELARQFAAARAHLDALANGAGTLAHVRMRVDELGSLDLYQWIYFLAQHARRHVAQLEELGRA